MLKITVNARNGISAFRSLQAQMPKQLSLALNKTARAARTEFINMLGPELRLKRRNLAVTKGGATTDLAVSRSDRLSTFFTPSRKTYNLGQVSTVEFNRKARNGITAQHNTVSGGGSANLHAPHAFRTKKSKNGGDVYNRIDFRAGKRAKRSPKGSWSVDSLHRRGVRAMRTTSPAAVMGQEDNPLRAKWERTAELGLTFNIPEAVTLAAEKSGF